MLECNDNFQINAHKLDANTGERTEVGAPLAEVEYLGMKVFRDDGELIWHASERVYCDAERGSTPQCRTTSPRFEPELISGNFTLRVAQLKARDQVGNEVTVAELTTPVAP